jgi:hypothetical protein
MFRLTKSEFKTILLYSAYEGAFNILCHRLTTHYKDLSPDRIFLPPGIEDFSDLLVKILLPHAVDSLIQQILNLTPLTELQERILLLTCIKTPTLLLS